MKSINIIAEYTKRIEKNLKKITNIVLGKYYVEEDFSYLLDIYIKARYYDSLDRKNKSPYFNTKIQIKDALQKLKQKKQVDEPTLKIYNEVLLGEQNNLKPKEIANNVEKYREELDLKNTDILEKITPLYEELEEARRKVQRTFKSNDFSCNYKGTNLNKVYIVNLDYSFRIPKLYSELAIEQVYTTGTINEDKLYIEYYLVTNKLLKEVINFDYSNNYIVEFASSLLEKETKLNKLLTVLSNDICKDKISIKIDFTDFIKHKDTIIKLINNGYNFAIKIDNTYEDTIENQRFVTSIFKYIMIDNNSEYISKFNEQKNLIKLK